MFGQHPVSLWISTKEGQSASIPNRNPTARVGKRIAKNEILSLMQDSEDDVTGAIRSKLTMPPPKDVREELGTESNWGQTTILAVPESEETAKPGIPKNEHLRILGSLAKLRLQTALCPQNCPTELLAHVLLGLDRIEALECFDRAIGLSSDQATRKFLLSRRSELESARTPTGVASVTSPKKNKTPG